MLTINRQLGAQTLTNKEYEVFNDLYGFRGGPGKIKIYNYLAANSVFDYLLQSNPEDIAVPVHIEEEEFQEMLKNFQFDEKKLDSLDQYSFELEKPNLEKRIKLKNSLKKGILFSRPLISGNYAILYLKTPCGNYVEQYVFAKKIVGVWVYYGDLMISAEFVDELVQPWIKRIWMSIFRNRYCD